MSRCSTRKEQMGTSGQCLRSLPPIGLVIGHSLRVRSISLLIAVLLASCGDAGKSNKAGVDGPVMRYPNSSGGEAGLEAEIRGVLQLEGMCLYIALDEIGERYPVVWPAGTRWDGESPSVVPPAGAPMPVGSQVYGGGGYTHVDDIERLARPEASARAFTCVDNEYDEIAVVNNRDTAIAVAEG